MPGLPLFVTRPQPDAARTAAAARALGMAAVETPLLTVEPLVWAPPEAPFDALLLTSANAPRCAGAALAALAHLPAYAVGEATAAAARAAGLRVAETGAADGSAILRRAAAAGHRHLLHLAGRDRAALAIPAGITLTTRAVYVAAAATALPAALAAADAGVVALFSARAARLFAALADAAALPRGRFALAALSAPVASAAGGGWTAVAAAARPDEAGLLAAARRLCQGAA